MTVSSGAVDDVAHHRFVLDQDGQEAELVYRRMGRRLLLMHTGVPEALSGHGIGGDLVRAAVAQARHDDLVLVPHCPFAARWLRDHADAVKGLSIEWPADTPL